MTLAHMSKTRSKTWWAATLLVSLAGCSAGDGPKAKQPAPGDGQAPRVDWATAPPAALLEGHPAFGEGARHVMAGRWADAKTSLVAALAKAPKSDPASVGARALLGRCNQQLGLRLEAESAYHEVLDAMADAKSRADAREVPAGKSVALSALAEALFYQAEELRVIAENVQAPVFSGERSKERVLSFVRGDLAVWVKKKLAAMQAVEVACKRLEQVEPAPPAVFDAACQQRIGALYEGYMRTLDGLPVPDEVAVDPVKSAEFRDAVAGGNAQHAHRGRAAYGRCAEIAEKHEVSPEVAASCKAWGAAHR